MNEPLGHEPDAPHCGGCNGICCRHIALEIDRPTTKREYDHIRWYLLHEGVSVFVEEGNHWYVQFSTPCIALDDRARCSAYSDRPRICRDYAVNECVRHLEELAPVLDFQTADQFVQWLDKEDIDWRFRNLPD